MIDSTSWGAFAVALTVLGGLVTWWSFRRRGARAGLRWLAVTLLPMAAYLTGTLRLVGRIGSAIASWAGGFVFSPVVWTGIVLAGVAVVLLGVAGRLPERGGARRPAEVDDGGSRRRREVAPTAGRSGQKAPKAQRAQKGQAPVDDEMAEIEAILRDRGIT